MVSPGIDGVKKSARQQPNKQRKQATQTSNANKQRKQATQTSNAISNAIRQRNTTQEAEATPRVSTDCERSAARHNAGMRAVALCFAARSRTVDLPRI
jgi:hypothetical protein